MTIASTTPSAIAVLLAECGELRRYGFGKELVPAGELPDGVWLIEKGSVRSLVPLPPKGDWRTVERYEAGCLVGWLGVLQERPIEHLRTADFTEALFLPAEQFRALWQAEAELRHWCGYAAGGGPGPAAPMPTRLAVGGLAIAGAAAPQAGGMGADIATPRRQRWEWHWPDGTVWPERPSQGMDPERLIWLPDPPDYEMVAISSEIDTIVEKSEAGQRSAGLPLANPEVLSVPRASGPRDIPMALCEALAQHCGVPFERDGIREQIEGLLERHQRLSLHNVGELLSSLDLSVSLAEILFGNCNASPPRRSWSTTSASPSSRWKTTGGCSCWNRNTAPCASQ